MPKYKKQQKASGPLKCEVKTAEQQRQEAMRQAENRLLHSVQQLFENIVRVRSALYQINQADFKPIEQINDLDCGVLTNYFNTLKSDVIKTKYEKINHQKEDLQNADKIIAEIRHSIPELVKQIEQVQSYGRFVATLNQLMMKVLNTNTATDNGVIPDPKTLQKVKDSILKHSSHR